MYRIAFESFSYLIRQDWYNTCMSLYAIYGKNEYLESQQRQRILKEERIEKDQVIELDASDKRKFRMESALVESNTISLFADVNRKAVILINPWFLKSSTKEDGSSKEDKQRNQLLKQLESYLKSPNPDVCFIFYLVGNDIDTRRKETKLLDKYHVKKIACDLIKPWEFPNHITELLKKNHFSLSPDARKEFDLRIGTDEFQLHHALEKMSLYGEKQYDLKTIKDLIPEDTNLDMWKLGNAFLQGNMEEVMRSKMMMESKGMQVMDIIPLFSSQLRRAYDIAQLRDLHYDNETIAVKLHMKDTAVRMNLKNLGNRSAKSILKMLTGLAQLDQEIKLGTANVNHAFDIYLLNYGMKR